MREHSKRDETFSYYVKITLCSEYYHIRKGDVFEPLINCKDHIWSSRDEHVKTDLEGRHVVVVIWAV